MFKKIVRKHVDFSLLLVELIGNCSNYNLAAISEEGHAYKSINTKTSGIFDIIVRKQV